LNVPNISLNAPDKKVANKSVIDSKKCQLPESNFFDQQRKLAEFSPNKPHGVLTRNVRNMLTPLTIGAHL